MNSNDSEFNTPRFRQKTLEVTVYSLSEDVDHTPAFEGQTSSVSREGVGVRVDPVGEFKFVNPKKFKGKKFIIQFHTGQQDLPSGRGKCTMIGPSEDLRYKYYLGFEFEEDLPLQELFKL